MPFLPAGRLDDFRSPGLPISLSPVSTLCDATAAAAFIPTPADAAELAIAGVFASLFILSKKPITDPDPDDDAGPDGDDLAFAGGDISGLLLPC